LTLMRAICETKDAPIWRIRLEAKPPAEEIVLSSGGLQQLVACCEQAAASASCRALVLEGSQGSFCRGMDLDALGEQPELHASVGVEQFAHCLRALRGCPRPVIALVDGRVVAGGVGLAAAADVIIATRRSTFALPEVVLGLVPAVVYPVLCERLPAQKARRMALLGQSIDAEEAAGLGLVDQLVPETEDLERALSKLARQLLRVQPTAVATLKDLARRVATLSADEAIGVGAACTAKILAEPTTVAHIRAFLEGEPLPWFARYRPRGAGGGGGN
jgi:enoyl-CoA hydratase/carnithine racemase